MNIRLVLSFCLFFAATTLSAQQQLKVITKVNKQHHSIQKDEIPGLPLAARPANGAVKPEKCGFANVLKRAKEKGYDEALYEEAFKKLIKKRLALGTTLFTGIVTVPVIFHSIYRTGQAQSTTTPNLPASQYQAQIDQLNSDYANISGSAYGVAADVRIRFCMAVVDTAGRLLAEPGIDRINGSTRGWSNTSTMNETTLEDYFESTIKPSSIWDPYSYFNVWTAAMNSSGLLGYATFPSFSSLSGLDNTESDTNAGVVIAWQSVGSVSFPGDDADYGYGRTLVHESGHFFGLRHIWGDANCGNDYCGDTPPQDDATSGCPSPGTLNNCTPSVAKMFENYMDYSNDACLNTFTANQALRCQTTMDNSPRRFSLMASKACQSRAGNAIQFATAPMTVSETGNAGTCPNTRSYSFNVYVSNKATGNATVTFNITGGTASQNIDYIISPASVSYTANDNAVKTITVTIIDDQVAEADETIELGYSIAGTGVVAGPDKQTLSLTIADDDVAGILVNNTASTKNILSENFNAAANIPANWITEVYDDGTSSYTPNQWVVSANGGTGTTVNAAHITRNTGTKSNQYNNANYSDAYLITPLLDATGARDVTLNFKWRCLGEADYDMGYIGYVPQGQTPTAENVIFFDSTFSGLAAATAARTATFQLPPALSNSKFYLVFNWYNDESTGSNPPFTIDDVTVTGKYFTVAGTADADTSFSQFANQTVSYYSEAASSRLIATVTNPNQNLGCVTASVQNVGTGKQILLTTSGGYYRADKVIKITPAVANTTATYQATLYFSATEISPAWTVAEIPQLKILKIKEGVDLSSTVSAADIQIVTPVFSDNASGSGYYSYTGSFTGFSQFVLGFPSSALPVRYISFDAKAQGKSIVLNWATSQELNNKGFKLERGIDGIHFEELAWVNGKGTTSLQADYAFSDNFIQPNTIYYYRLKQVNTDGGEYLSDVRKAHISRKEIVVSVSPVPVRDVLNVFIAGDVKVADMNLMNAQGQLVRSIKNITGTGSSYKLNVSNLPSGIYMLNVVLPGEKIVKKILIEQ